MNNPAYFDSTGNFDFYERSISRNGDDCLDGKYLFKKRNEKRNCFYNR